jgi:hypothetical protein
VDGDERAGLDRVVGHECRWDGKTEALGESELSGLVVGGCDAEWMVDPQRTVEGIERAPEPVADLRSREPAQVRAVRELQERSRKVARLKA